MCIRDSCKPCSASNLETPYGSSGAGASSAANGMPNAVCSPFTLMELIKTKRLTPASAAWRARLSAVSYTHLRAHETDSYLVCRLLLEKKKTKKTIKIQKHQITKK